MAKGGGGAWKVAYADFVTAMMAFFLVMWICGQDQQLRRAVSHYFNDPLNTSMVGTSKKPSRSGSVRELNDTGSVPSTESVDLGRGRRSYSLEWAKSDATKAVSDTISTDDASRSYWREQAQQARKQAMASKEVRDRTSSTAEVAARHLAKQLRDEVTRDVPGSIQGVYRDLVYEALARVSWTQIAEDLLGD